MPEPAPTHAGAPAPDPMRPVPYRVSSVRKETADTVTLTLAPLEGPCLRFEPGQFNMLWHVGAGEVAISVSGDPADGSRLVHTLRAVGSVTREVVRLKRGAVLGVRGPFGRPWPVADLDGDDVVIVAGGIGLAPLRPVIYHVLRHRDRVGRVLLFLGARTPDDLLFVKEIQAWRARFDTHVSVTVDRAPSGWRGNVGVVTSLLRRVAYDPAGTTAFVCGPEVMMRYAAMELETRGVGRESIWVSGERNMKCAIGLCGHCQLSGLFVCKDGPVFRYDHVAELMARREL